MRSPSRQQLIAEFPQRHSRCSTEVSRGYIDVGKNPIRQNRACIADTRRSGADRPRGELTLVKQRQARDSRPIEPDARIAEEHRSQVRLNQPIGSALKEGRMRSGHNDTAGIGGLYHRRRVDTNQTRFSWLIAHHIAAAPGDRRHGGIDHGRKLEVLSALAHGLTRCAAILSGVSINVADATKPKHVLAVSDVAGHDVGRCSRQTDVIEVIESVDARIVLTDAGIVQHHAADTTLAGVEGVVAAAIRPGDQDVSPTFCRGGGTA